MGPVRGTYKNPTDLQKYDGLTKIRHSDFGAVRANGPSETHANKSDPTREGRDTAGSEARFALTLRIGFCQFLRSASVIFARNCSKLEFHRRVEF